MTFARIFLGSVPKEGNKENENEDALVLHPHQKELKLTSLRCAVADGATQASFSRLWANLLVDGAVKSKLTPSIKKAEQLVINSYESWESNLQGIELPWFAEEKMAKGAFSSLLWVGINSNTKRNYSNLSAVSIGDSELIILRKEKIYRSHPLASSREFNSSPILISSKEENNRFLKFGKLRVQVVAGDDIILVTDALGKYLLSQFEAGINPLYPIRSIFQTTSDQTKVYKSWIDSKRKEKVLKNDDSTMIWIHLFDKENKI